MANWNLPTIASPYDQIPGLLRDLSIDAATLFATDPTNPIDGMIKLVRSPVKFQERASGAWADRVLSVAGGGTGASTPGDARAGLGLGTMAIQNADAVAITGGTLAGNGAGLTSLNASALASGTVPQARKWTESTITSTGTQNDASFADADALRCSNTALLMITGLLAGVPGQRLDIVSVGAGQVQLINDDAGSTPVNRIINGQSGAITLAPGAGRAFLQYDGGAARWRVLAFRQGAATREVLTANRTYYVRPLGNDANDGLSNDDAHAFSTIQHAVDVVASLDCQNYDVTIQVSDGTYTSPVSVGPMLGSGVFKITGAVASPPGVIVSTTSAPCFTFQGCLQKSPFVIANLEMRTAGSAGDCLAVTNASLVGLDNVVFGACVGNHVNCVRHSQVVLMTNYTVNGNAQTHLRAIHNGLIVRGAGMSSVTNSATPSFSIAYAQASQGGLISVSGATFNGFGTGQRFFADLTGVIYTNSSGNPDFFPGNAAGSTATGGQYA